MRTNAEILASPTSELSGDEWFARSCLRLALAAFRCPACGAPTTHMQACGVSDVNEWPTPPKQMERRAFCPECATELVFSTRIAATGFLTRAHADAQAA